jgi:hypothetical protein
MVGMEMGIHDKPDVHAGLAGNAHISFDVAQGVYHGTGGMCAAAKQVRDCHRVGMEELTAESCWSS